MLQCPRWHICLLYSSETHHKHTHTFTHTHPAGVWWWTDESILPALFLALCRRAQGGVLNYLVHIQHSSDNHTQPRRSRVVWAIYCKERKKLSLSPERSNRVKKCALVSNSSQERKLISTFWTHTHYVRNCPQRRERLKSSEKIKFLGCDFRYSSILHIFEMNPHPGLGEFMPHLAPFDVFSSTLKERYKKKCQKHFSYSFNPCAH